MSEASWPSIEKMPHIWVEGRIPMLFPSRTEAGAVHISGPRVLEETRQALQSAGAIHTSKQGLVYHTVAIDCKQTHKSSPLKKTGSQMAITSS